MRQDERRTAGPLDHLRHGERLSRTRHSQQNLMFLSVLCAAAEFLDRGNLVAARLVVHLEAKRWHALRIAESGSPICNEDVELVLLFSVQARNEHQLLPIR